ncbi:MAG: hypothetical protein NTU65_06695, partial [Cyanobacteria bacterium]|nr:hypothetical protein [Cyanobacteriota bacterium]
KLTVLSLFKSPSSWHPPWVTSLFLWLVADAVINSGVVPWTQPLPSLAEPTPPQRLGHKKAPFTGRRGEAERKDVHR